MTEITLQRLSRFDACALSDACDRLGLPPAVTGIVSQTVKTKIFGRVQTVKLAAGTPPADMPPKHLCSNAIETAQAGEVIVIEQRTGIDAAGWGGILSNAARVKGLAGVIVDGPARDIDEAAGLGFPVYARGSTARTARGRIYEAETGGPVTIGETKVETGDYVLADRSGMVFVPQGEIQRVLDTAEAIAAREAVLTAQVLEGVPVGTVMGAKYESMLDAGKDS
ncbi:MAG: RraA family protein [Henriciella sp.]|nr:RraA family protein [Henriciella sp.]